MRHYSDPKLKPERGKHLYARCTGEGRATWINLGTSDSAVADAVVQGLRIQEALAPVRALVPVDDARLFPEVWRQWLLAVNPTLRPSSVHSLARTGASLSRLQGRRLADLTTADLRASLDALRDEGLAPGTIGLRRAHIRMFGRWCLEEGLLRVNPALPLRAIPQDAHEPRSLTADELSRLRAVWASERVNVVVSNAMSFACETGLRIGNVVALDWSEVDLTRGWIEIKAEKMKARRDFSAPLSVRALEILRAGRDRVRGPVFPGLTRSSLDHQARRVFRLAGIEGGHMHLMRSTFITQMARSGVAPEVCMRLSGHRDYKTVLQHYRSVEVSELLQAVGRGLAQGHEISG
jgi:integrase